MALPQAPYTDDGDSGIDFFKSRFLTTSGGLSRPTRYSVYIEQDYDGYDSGMTFHPEIVVLPGRLFHTVTEQWWGPQRKIPVGRVFNNDLIMTFPVSVNWLERAFFEGWMDDMVNPATNESLYSSDGTSCHGNMTLYLLGNGPEQKTMATFEFQEVYPAQIIPINMGFSQQNDYTRLQVMFNFRQYKFSSDSDMSKFANDIPSMKS